MTLRFGDRRLAIMQRISRARGLTDYCIMFAIASWKIEQCFRELRLGNG